ncbi:hypothetical protein T265_11885 [Opisthorchis viverrini]|uniref:Uncharacterized protein n=1 Tax=Opisthorchis viverrini TaxID=6198 RepID=A0A074YXB2_OPIVI|nr:hypothetical protein T265_11885 [Opisthorchis viverrini]KER19288.1 hypothetical protein T265_11885 [Opisthorchis viverrini]
MTSAFNTDNSMPYNHDLFESLIVKKRIKIRTNLRAVNLITRSATIVHRIKPFSHNILSVPSCHATRGKHKGWDPARLPEPRQEEPRRRGRVQTTELPVLGSNPTYASPPLLSRLRQPGSIPTLVLPPDDIVARHRKGIAAERFIIFLLFHRSVIEG